jgi:hypothetical protein
LRSVVVVDEEQGTAVRADVVRGQVLGSPVVEAGDGFGDDLVACGGVSEVGESGEPDVQHQRDRGVVAPQRGDDRGADRGLDVRRDASGVTRGEQVAVNAVGERAEGVGRVGSGVGGVGGLSINPDAGLPALFDKHRCLLFVVSVAVRWWCWVRVSLAENG